MPVFGIGDAFFNPAATAIAPDLVSAEELTQANAIDGVRDDLRLLFPIGKGPGDRSVSPAHPARARTRSISPARAAPWAVGGANGEG
jgi:hypothetical protein